METIRVTVISPYVELKNVVDSVLKEKKYNFEIESFIGDLDMGVSLAKEAEKKGTDIIISRGGTAQAIQNAVSIPVVEIDISSYDMLCTVALIKDYPGKAALVGFPSITDPTKAICELLDIDINVFPINSIQELEETFPILMSKGFSVIVGDVIAVEYARRLGLGNILLTSGKKSVTKAFDDARKIFEHMSLLKKRVSLYKRVLRNVDEAIFVANEKGEVIYRNRYAVNNEDKWKITSSLFTKWIPLANGEKNTSFKITQNDFLLEVHLTVEKDAEDSPLVLIRISECYAILQEEGVYLYNTLQLNVLYDTNIIFKNLLNKNMKEIISRVDEFNKMNLPIIISGEKSTGKENLAVYIHQESQQEELTPFLKVDCSLLNKKTMEIVDEFILQVSTKGTLFLKDLHLAKPEEQADLLEKVTSTTLNMPKIIISSVDPYIPNIEANRCLSITLPPLRERAEDIELFVRFFINRHNLKHGKQIVGIREDALNKIRNYSWDENISQLDKILNKIFMISEGPYISSDEVNHVFEEKPNPHYGSIPIYGTLEDIENRIIMMVWEDENKNNTKTAKRLGINRTTLWRKLNSLSKE